MRVLFADATLYVLFALCFGASKAVLGISLPPILKAGGRSGTSGGGSRGVIGTGAGTGRGLSGDTGHPSIATSGVNGRTADYFSSGGGKRFTLKPPSVFAGRQAGGGARTQVLGTRRYGSGYPYYSQDPSSQGVVGQPFPFGFWPIFWAGHGHGDEYGGNSTVTSQRPGGNLTYVQLVPTASSGWNTTAVDGVNETYWMIGDSQSVATLLSILLDTPNNTTSPYGCGVENLGPYNFDSSDTSLPFQFENVVQWYRSSSFALAYQDYNNTYALSPLNQTTGLGWNDSVPLPDEQLYSPFLACINNTLSAALPILDAPSSKLTAGDIVGIVIGSMVGATVIFTLLCCWFGGNLSCGKNRKQGKKEQKNGKREDLEAKLAKIKSEYTKEIEAVSRKNTIEFPAPMSRQDESGNILPAKDNSAIPSPYSVESGMSSAAESSVKHTQIAMPEPRQV